MNETINVELTPSEARELVGLPDVKPFHNAALARVEQSVMAQADKFSAAGPMDTWFAGSPGRPSCSATWLAVCSRKAARERNPRRSRKTQFGSSKAMPQWTHFAT
jgi:Family of unknown function (DUF6489)